MASTKAKSSSKSSKTAKPAAGAKGPITVLVGTRKGLWTIKSDAGRKTWSLAGPTMLGSIIYHVRLDPRDRKTLLLSTRTGHLGPTIFRSTDRGRTWKEATKPPAFAKVPEGQLPPGEKAWVVDHTFWLTPGHASEPGVWWAGTSPQGLFRSADGGVTWESVNGFNDHPMKEKWTGGLKDMTPDGGKMHSILIDPRDKNHMYLAMSSGGIFESTSYGADWKPLNKGVSSSFNPDPAPEFGHDPHCVAIHPTMPDRLYHQNHEGIYRIDRMLTHLKLAGLLSKIRGFIWGQCSECEPDSSGYGSLTIEEVLDDHIKPLGVPTYRGAMIGHIEKQFTVPEGILAEMDAEAGTFRLMESAVAG